MNQRRGHGGIIERARTAHSALVQALACGGADPGHEAALLVLRTMFLALVRKHGLLGGMTSPHGLLAGQSEERPDVAAVLERLQTELDAFPWKLTDGPPHQPNAVTPAALADVFEELVNQGQPGAYSTGPDVADFICRSTVLPCLLERVQAAYPAAFTTDGPVWTLLRRSPDRYLFPEIRHGVGLLLPPDIAQGLDDPPRRAVWEAPAPSAYALPGETWREVVNRRAWYEAARRRLASGTVCDPGDLVTLNLDMPRFLLEVLAACGDPALRRAFSEALHNLTVLDPACGSGAFLLAALDLLEPLYDACVDEAETGGPVNRRLAIRAAILTRNLYGVDILPAAVEMARLRCLLHLAACCTNADEFALIAGLEFNLRAGNALVGRPFAAATQVAGHGRPDARNAFAWPDAFPKVAARGGFDVVVGNPPFVEVTARSIPYYRQLQDYQTARCRNLYPCVVERGRALLRPDGWLGMVLPLAAFGTRNMAPFVAAWQAWFPQTWVSFYHFRPAMLFSAGRPASLPTAIALGRAGGAPARWSTGVRKWPGAHRDRLFRTLAYAPIEELPCPVAPHAYPKLSSALENGMLRKLRGHPPVRQYLADTDNGNTVYYRSAGGLYWKVVVNFPWPYETTSNKQRSFQMEYDRDVFVALFNSSLFWWYYTITFDTLNLKDYLLFGVPFTYPDAPGVVAALKARTQELMACYRASAAHLRRGGTGSYTISARRAKPVLDAIDRLLAACYSLNAEELDFILSYDLKHRMGGQGRDA